MIESGLSYSWSNIKGAVLPWTEAHAEVPPMKEETDNDRVEGDNKSNKVKAVSQEEEEEEELVDPKETLEEECKNSKACSPAKHHFDECVERVTGDEKGSQDEDCVEESPKLWKVLK